MRTANMKKKSTEHRGTEDMVPRMKVCGASSIRHLSDEDGHNRKRQQKKLSKALDDHWDGGSRTYDSDVKSGSSNGERGTYSSHIHNKKSLRSVKCEVFEDERPQIISPSNSMAL